MSGPILPRGPGYPKAPGLRFRTRRATRADLPLLIRHRTRMWEDIGGYPPSQLANHARVYRRWASARLPTGELVGFIAETRDGRAAGSGCVWLQDAQPRPGMPQPNSPYILSMFTEPQFRGLGVATQTLRAALTFCRSRGFARVTLHASVQGRPIYTREGFERTWEMRRWLDPQLARLEQRRLVERARSTSVEPTRTEPASSG